MGVTIGITGGGGGTDDQTAAEVAFTPTGNTVATDSQSAIVELQTEIDGIQTAIGALAADGNSTPIVAIDAIEDVAPTAIEAPSPVAGDTANKLLTDGKEERWSHNGATWTKAYVVDHVANQTASEIAALFTADAAASETMRVNTKQNFIATPFSAVVDGTTAFRQYPVYDMATGPLDFTIANEGGDYQGWYRFTGDGVNGITFTGSWNTDLTAKVPAGADMALGTDYYAYFIWNQQTNLMDVIWNGC